MDKFTVIKNGLVLTLDRNNSAGYFNIVLKNGKIILLDNERKFNQKEFLHKYPDAEIIDAENKLIAPGFFNSKICSAFALNNVFFKKCNYENINSWLSLKSIYRFLSSKQNESICRDLLEFNYLRCEFNGEIFLSENSNCLSYDFYKNNFNNTGWINQYFNTVIFDLSVVQEIDAGDRNFSVGFETGEQINNYSLSSLKKAITERKLKIFIESSLSASTSEAVKRDFGKSFINVLLDMELISPNTVIVNPVRLNSGEIDILNRKKASVLLCPSDYVNLSDGKIDFDELFYSGINIMIGTGFTGRDVLSELKILSSMMNKSSIKYNDFIKIAVRNPSVFFGISNLTGSIERNKSADLVFYSLDDIRNLLTIPELDPELICEFLIQNLKVKDITDVIVKGKFIIKNKESLNEKYPDIKNKAKDIADVLFSEGKYFEFKEKYLMRSRVENLNSDRIETPAKNEEIFVDYTDTTEIYLGEGEFTIIGKREEEFEKERKETKSDEVVPVEIISIETDLNLLDDLTEEQEIKLPFPKSKIEKEKTLEDSKNLKIRLNTAEENETEATGKSESDKTGSDVSDFKTSEQQDSERVTLKKSKLQFGFGDEGKK